MFLWFRAIELNLRQFYGQTENCALAVAQNPADISLTTVGRPFPGVETKIDEHGEILLRGDNIFDSYFLNPKATAEALQDGWLHTGDADQIEPDGRLSFWAASPRWWKSATAPASSPPISKTG